MLKRILPILIALSVLLTACGAQGTPTPAAADVEGTAVAAAWTMVAATQMAIPTATQLPPTEIPSPTPLPTFTPPPLLELPTATFVLPSPTTVASGDDCNHPLNVGEAGETNPMRVENASGGTIAWLSLNLSKNKFGQCGALSWSNIAPGAKFVVQLPKGIWWAYAGISFKNGSSSNASGSFELRLGDEDLLRIIIGKEVITVHA